MGTCRLICFEMRQLSYPILISSVIVATACVEMDGLSNLWCRIFIFQRGLRFLRMETYGAYLTLHSNNAPPEVWAG